MRSGFRLAFGFVSLVLTCGLSLGCADRIPGPDRIPRACAGADRQVLVGEAVILDGSASSDPEDEPLSYHWSVVSAPSLASLADRPFDAVRLDFTPDVEGTWVFKLVVSDGRNRSLPDVVTITSRRSCQSSVDCDDDEPCTTDNCLDRICFHASVENGTACDDGQWCTMKDACANGRCQGDERDCGATGYPCSELVCDEFNDQCVYAEMEDGHVCEDGLYCTVGETCHQGDCQGATARDCSELDGPCSVGQCDEKENACLAISSAAAENCGDGVDNDCDGYTDSDDVDCGGLGDWWNADWMRRRKLTFDNTDQNEDLVDFPVLVRLSNEALVQNDFNANGSDLRFVSSDAETELAHEIELFRFEDQLAEIWVKVPRITAGSGTDFIWLYYKNSDAVPAQRPDDVFTNDYVGVWHMHTDPNAGARDSSPYHNDGQAVNMGISNLIRGVSGPAYNFDGSDDAIRIPSDPGDELALTGPAFTLEACIARDLPTGNWQVVIGRQLGSGDVDSYNLYLDSQDPSILRLLASDFSLASASGVVPQGQWICVAGVRDQDQVILYAGGRELARRQATAGVATDDNDTTIGAQENGPDQNLSERFRGGIDEVRISSKARSAAWIRAGHLNLSGEFVNLEPPENRP